MSEYGVGVEQQLHHRHRGASAAQQHASAGPPNSSAGAASAPAVIVPDRESEIILPPPSASNPVPALPVALRLDNQEQLLQLLRTDPTSATATGGGSAGGNFRQLLVFGTESMRTLIMRQVLSSDPQHQSRSFSKGKMKKNWDEYLSFPAVVMQQQGQPGQPQQQQQHHHGLNILGTRILTTSTSSSGGADATGGAMTTTSNNGGGGFDDDGDDVFGAAAAVAAKKRSSPRTKVDLPTETWDVMDEGVEVVTYFLHPSDLAQTKDAAEKIRSFNRSKMSSTSTLSSNMPFRTHHRIVYLPRVTAVVRRVLCNAGLASLPNVSVRSLQLDVYPLESDVLSLEYGSASRETTDVDGTPSLCVETIARSVMKIQDVVGRVPRIQAYGPTGEDVVRKLLDLTVDEYLAGNGGGQHRGTGTDDGGDDAADEVEDDEYDNNIGEAGPVEYSEENGGVAGMIIMDRRVDYVTPMLTPLTYEGLLDDVVGIDCGYVNVDVDIINPPEDDPKNKNKKADDVDRPVEVVALGLNGSDSLYAEVRNQHVEKFGLFLQNQAKALQDTHANFTSKGKKKDLSEIHQFVKQIPIFTQNLRSLTNHIHLAELVKKTSDDATFRERWQLERSMLEGETCYDQLEELVASQYPPLRFLRLLCLQSLCSGGIKSSRYDAIRRDVVQTYGYEYLFVLTNLEKAGLLSRREGLWMDTASPFSNLRKSLILINAEVDTVDPDDISYVSSGYAPLTVRLIQTAMKGWTGREDILREGPGRLVDITQQNPPEDLAAALKRPVACSLGQFAADISSTAGGNVKNNNNNGGGTTTKGRKPVLIVFYIGGVTYMELASLRFLSKRPKFPYHIICCTTKVINGGTYLRSLA